MKRKVLTCVALFCVTNTGFVQAADAAPAWFECSGERAVTRMADGKPRSETAPVRDIYILDDATRNVYQYFEATKSRGLQNVSSYGPSQITWGYTQAPQEAAWQGTLDRTTKTLKVVRRKDQESETRTAVCKAIPPRK